MDKNRIRGLTAIAIKNGDIPIAEKCETCGTNSNIVAHHYNGYAFENRFDIKWLCDSCHKSLHNKMRNHAVMLEFSSTNSELFNRKFKSIKSAKRYVYQNSNKIAGYRVLKSVKSWEKVLGKPYSPNLRIFKEL